jgi:transposase
MERVVDRQLVPEGERTCPHCGVEGKTLCFKHCEKLSIRPVQYIVERVERETISCPKCHEWVRTAPRGDEVLDRGKLGNELLVQACVDHFDHAIPWDRMASVARQQGVPLSANTLARSVGRLIDLFDPIVAHITAKVLSSEYVSFDATSYRVLDDEHPRGIRTGALWSLAGDHRYALFFAAPTGHADHLKERLKGYKLSLAMCDGSATNNVIEAEDGCGAIRGGCWAHARRKLIAALRGGDERRRAGDLPRRHRDHRLRSSTSRPSPSAPARASSSASCGGSERARRSWRSSARGAKDVGGRSSRSACSARPSGTCATSGRGSRASSNTPRWTSPTMKRSATSDATS